ncbi:MAG: LLM class flavin-dependent oxidoreductase [Chloroflexi bacterium]|nr:LLM class flavin-dependent oxidoreductase [Chloroflexota bacterium]
MSIPADLQFIFMHQMPYNDLAPGQEKHESVWVDFPNSYFDPKHARELWQRYLREMSLADRLGFDGLLLTEHHSTIHSMNASCSVMASQVIAHTEKAKIYVAGTPVNLEYPNRLAEEYGMLDVLSGGRLVCCFPLGTGMEYWSNANQLNPATARARLRESIQVIRRAWTEEGPISFDGEFFNYRYLNVWPRPYQQPHPKMYMVGSGSPETMQFAAKEGYGYSMVLLPFDIQLKAFKTYRDIAAEHGHSTQPDQLMFSVQVYVGETEEEAEREARPHLLYGFHTSHRTAPRYHAPPGYVTVDEFRRRVARPYMPSGSRDEIEAALENRLIIFGTPDRVVETLAQWTEEAGSNRMITLLHFADMPHWKTVKNLTMFAQEVMPRLRKLSGSGAPAKAERQPAATAA